MIKFISFVNILIKICGKKNAIMKNILDINMDSCIPIPIICSIVFVSFFPQYCAASMITPEEIPV